ncbi:MULTISPECIES: DesA family fatty acid desaturase [Methylocaldum]|jgi:stearoyl-CoA desaturase (delta-9 desaturase)|uniref:DesA family fatty acid desaturase n=1 Tax=unclassified Methylocaldum TaxID=2622260 RepID=UPI00098B2920|nr:MULTISPECIES: fatty acid desaturase [unclassified Methylocaldum]MBP1148856.1 stearoyl-CoA desaturase (delta-9 desaturase) [Methylocaldum sp. RMAD-M]MDV3242908.1 fatty acid desaturase [Methylocaldum sp.]MVF20675.1 acyl-CoA desaturase [Methylocaldum sp. BRCS4]
MINGLLDLPWWGLIAVTLGLTHITIASVTIFLHRHQAHRALDLHPAVSHFFRLWLWLTTGMGTKAWVAIHRKHHAKCETPEDPHSPRVFGISKVLWEGAELYRTEAANPETLDQYGYGTPDDWLERKLYSPHPGLGVALMFLADVALFGFFGITIWAVQMLWIPFWAAGVINGLGHFSGYRNFETRDASTNLFPIGLLIGGEELHNNHHAYPSSARLSSRWWELDIGWAYIRLMELLKLATVRRVAPKIRILHDKKLIDLATIQAVMRNRVHVLALYGRSVVLPVLRQELKTALPASRRLLRDAKPLLVREDIQFDEAATHILDRALNLSQTLHTVYQFKEELKQLWANSSVGYEARVQSLREWCQRAKETGIQSLHEFADLLHGYTITNRLSVNYLPST